RSSNTLGNKIKVASSPPSPPLQVSPSVPFHRPFHPPTTSHVNVLTYRSRHLWMPSSPTTNNMGPKPVPTTAAPPRPEMKPRALSTDLPNTTTTPTRTLSPTSTLSPTTTHTSSNPAPKGHHSFLSSLTRARSKSPRPPLQDITIPTSTTLKHVQTSPLPG